MSQIFLLRSSAQSLHSKTTWHVSVPGIQDCACEVSQIFEEGCRILQLQKLLLFVLEEWKSKAKYDLCRKGETRDWVEQNWSDTDESFNCCWRSKEKRLFWCVNLCFGVKTLKRWLCSDFPDTSGLEELTLGLCEIGKPKCQVFASPAPFGERVLAGRSSEGCVPLDLQRGRCPRFWTGCRSRRCPQTPPGTSWRWWGRSPPCAARSGRGGAATSRSSGPWTHADPPADPTDTDSRLIIANS